MAVTASGMETAMPSTPNVWYVVGVGFSGVGRGVNCPTLVTIPVTFNMIVLSEIRIAIEYSGSRSLINNCAPIGYHGGGEVASDFWSIFLSGLRKQETCKMFIRDVDDK